MSVELVPSITATTVKQLRRLALLAEKLSSLVHLDVMDGKFVPTKSVGVKQLAIIPWQRQVEIHAMVNDAAKLLPIIDIVKPKRVYLQIERGEKLFPIFSILRSKKIECGLAIKPRTYLQRLKPYARYAKAILVLGVQPGGYQATLEPLAFSRIRKLHRQWPRITIVADGSMSEQTIHRAIQAGAKRIIIGSAVMLSKHPETEWDKLRTLTKAG
jgi:ribulose-phosphate 3-epimerase